MEPTRKEINYWLDLFGKTTRANLALHQILGLLKLANDGGQIRDTLWAGNHTTLFEFIEHEIEVIETPQP